MYQVNLPTVSNKEDWITAIEVTDSDSGDAVDLSSATIVFAVKDQKTKGLVLTATTADDTITIDDDTTGRFQWSFTEDQMGGVCPATYDVGCTVEIDDVTTQLFVGTVSVVDGVVP